MRCCILWSHLGLHCLLKPVRIYTVIKVLQALPHALPLHLHQASAITLSKIKCVLDVMPINIFARLQGNLWNRFQVIERAHIYDLDHYYVQRADPPKAELRFLCFANCIMVIYICIKFQENILNSFQVTGWTKIYYRNHYFQNSKCHNSKIG